MEAFKLVYIIAIVLLIVLAVIYYKRKEAKNSSAVGSTDKASNATPREEQLDPILSKTIKKDNDISYLRKAGVVEDEILYTEIIYDTGDGYGGKLITYNSRQSQFNCHAYGWHLDDSQEFKDPVPCSPKQAVSIIANCNHDSKSKIPAIERISKISGIDVSGIIKKQKTKYYLFEDSEKIVKQEDYLWYERDRENHQWVQANYRMGRYFDAAYAVVEIDYDENKERIINRYPIFEPKSKQ